MNIPARGRRASLSTRAQLARTSRSPAHSPRSRPSTRRHSFFIAPNPSTPTRAPPSTSIPRHRAKHRKVTSRADTPFVVTSRASPSSPCAAPREGDVNHIPRAIARIEVRDERERERERARLRNADAARRNTHRSKTRGRCRAREALCARRTPRTGRTRRRWFSLRSLRRPGARERDDEGCERGRRADGVEGG